MARRLRSAILGTRGAQKGVCVMRILVVEDHDATRLGLMRLLRQAGHDVTTATGVAEAQSLLEGHPFDLLICDHSLPDGDGGALATPSRECGAKFILVSTAPRSDADCDAHLLKPLSVAALEQTIARVMASAASTRLGMDAGSVLSG
jgi:CheY-like chemotaxis protein